MPIVRESLKVIRQCLRVPWKTDSMRCAALLHSTGGAELGNGGASRNFRGPKFSFGRFFGIPTFWDSWLSSLLPCSDGMGHAFYLDWF